MVDNLSAGVKPWVIATASNKGGASKSAFCYALANAIVSAGGTVGIVCADDGKTNSPIVDWALPTGKIPAVRALQESEYLASLNKIKAHGVQVVLVDNGPRESALMRRTLDNADCVLLPWLAAGEDTQRAVQMHNFLQELNDQRRNPWVLCAGQSKRPAGAVENTILGKQMENALRDGGIAVLPGLLENKLLGLWTLPVNMPKVMAWEHDNGEAQAEYNLWPSSKTMPNFYANAASILSLAVQAGWDDGGLVARLEAKRDGR